MKKPICELEAGAMVKLSDYDADSFFYLQLKSVTKAGELPNDYVKAVFTDGTVINVWKTDKVVEYVPAELQPEDAN